jgi:hypothetical protein
VFIGSKPKSFNRFYSSLSTVFWIEFGNKHLLTSNIGGNTGFFRDLIACGEKIFSLGLKGVKYFSVRTSQSINNIIIYRSVRRRYKDDKPDG